MAHQSDILAYAPVRRRRWLCIRVIAVVAAILFAFWAARQVWIYYYRPWEWYGSIAAWEQHRYGNYRQPASYIVTELKPIWSDGKWELERMAAPSSQHHAEWETGIPHWRDLVFCHERTNRAGKSRVVMIFLGHFYWEDKALLFRAEMSSLKPHGGPDNYDSKRVYKILRIPLTPDTYNVYFGQPDPKDDSHFTIKYEINGKPGTIDGWLQSDDTVKLQIRDGPATKP